MAVDTRRLLARTKDYRPDLEDGKHYYALTTAARSLCQETSAFQVIVVVAAPVGAARAAIPFEWILANALSDTTAPQYDPVHVKDLYYSPQDESPHVWKRVGETNLVDLDYKVGTAQGHQYDSSVTGSFTSWGEGLPKLWANDNTQLIIYPLPDATNVYLKVVMAVQPQYDNIEWAIDLSPKAEAAIVSGALSTLLEYPGDHQNLNLAAKHGRRFEDEVANIKAIEMMGSSGTLEFRLSRPFVTPKRSVPRLAWPE